MPHAKPKLVQVYRHMLEKHIVQKIMRWLRANGFWCVKIHGGEFQQAGLPDVLAIRDGRACWFEVKRPGGKATPLQARTIAILKEYGCTAGVVYSIEDVVRLLDEQDKIVL